MASKLAHYLLDYLFIYIFNTHMARNRKKNSDLIVLLSAKTKTADSVCNRIQKSRLIKHRWNVM